MWRKLRKAILILVASIATLIALFCAFVVLQHRASKRAYAEHDEDDRNAEAYAVRLRADGDRLAKEGAWEDARARYQQAYKYDHTNEDPEKARIIAEHVGEVVFDKEFEAHGSPP